MSSSKIKRNQSAQPIYWLLAAITIAGIVFMLWPQKDTYIALRPGLKFSGEQRAIVSSYLRWNEGASETNMTINHDFTAEGLRKMSRALGVLSDAVSKRVSAKSAWRIDTIKSVAALLIEDRESRQHTDKLREAFTAAEDLLALIQSHSFPELEYEIKLLSSEVSMIKDDKLLLEQKSEIIAIYHQIAVILKRMTNIQIGVDSKVTANIICPDESTLKDRKPKQGLTGLETGKIWING